MSEIVRIRNFNPEKVAPNFIAHLRTAGEVVFGDEIGQDRRWGFRNDNQLCEFVTKEVILNGNPIGRLEVSIKPPAVGYAGVLPEEIALADKKRGRSRVSRNNVPEGFVAVSAHHHYPDPLAAKVGRTDRWKNIPLP